MQDTQKPLKLTPFLQSSSMCGPASLKIALSFFHKEYSEKSLAKLSGATRKIGTLHQGLIDAAESLGAHVHAQDKGTILQLKKILQKKRLPIIIGWYMDDKNNSGDHFSVVYHMTNNFIFMMDPGTKTGYRKMSLPHFKKLWYDFDVDETKKIFGWYMVLRFSL